MHQEKKYLNLKETATFLGISRPTVYKWVECGKIKPAYRASRSWVFDPAKLAKHREQEA